MIDPILTNHRSSFKTGMPDHHNVFISNLKRTFANGTSSNYLLSRFEKLLSKIVQQLTGIYNSPEKVFANVSQHYTTFSSFENGNYWT